MSVWKQISVGWRPLFVLGIFTGLAYLLARRHIGKRRAAQEEELLKSRSGYEDPPRLTYHWPLALDLLQEARKADQAGKILDFFLSLMRRTGDTFEQILLGARGIDTHDPENLEAVLSTQFHNFSLGTRPACFRPLLGDGIFTQDGAAWKASRDLVRPQFKETRSKSFVSIQREIEALIGKIEKSDGIIDLQPLFFRLTLNTTMAVLFGRSMEDLEKQSPVKEEQFAEAFDQAQHRLAERGRLGDFYWLLGGRSFSRSCNIVHQFVDAIVTSSLEDADQSGIVLNADDTASDTDRYVFVEALIARTRDRRVLRDQLINILLAGRDTTACLLSWTFNLLADHQDVQERLRKECTALQSFWDGQTPTQAEIKECKFLSSVLFEVLRLYPSVPVNSRFATKTTTLPIGGGKDGKSPILVRKGEAVGFCVYTLHRRKDIYGPDADEFRPSRWEGEGLSKLGWAYLPFNGGPRICPGREFALLEASYAVIRILQTFGQIVRPEAASSPPRHSLTLVVASADGCKVKLSK